MSSALSWYWFVIKWEVRELWRALPGPWYVKASLLIITQLIPGPQDEILLLLVLAVLQKRREKRVQS